MSDVNKISLQRMVKETGRIPNSFVLENGLCFTVEYGIMSSGEHMAMIWQMRKTKKIHLYMIAYGSTEDEAKESLKNKIIKS